MKTKLLALILCAVIMLSLCSCAKGSSADIWDSATYEADTTLGDGAKTITLKVVAEEKTVTLTIKTDAETLGEALLAHSLVEGEDGQYGLYIKKVNGMLADYDVDQTYWLLTQNGEYVMSGVDTTSIDDGEQYELTRTK